MLQMVRPRGFEPLTQWLKAICSTYWAKGATGAVYRNWTYNLLITSQLLCRIELKRQMVEVKGLEPMTPAL